MDRSDMMYGRAEAKAPQRRGCYILLAALAAMLVATAALEGISRVLVWRRTHAFKLYRVTQVPAFWSDMNPSFGVWHKPNATFHHVEKCWDVTYHTNSYGARDTERSLRSSVARRHIVLGDSFIEGYAIPDGERLTDRLTASTGTEFLNFGTGGGFGTVQELMLYRTLASSFDHSDVLLFVLPVNDFSDNDPKYFPQSRYRPYLRRTGLGVEIYYTVTFERRDPGTLSRAMVAWNWLNNQLYLLNLPRQAVEHRLQTEIQPPYSSYEGYSAEELDTMTEAIRLLAEAAAPRPVRVYLIPLQVDLDGYMQQGKRYRLTGDLRASLQHLTKIDVVDLLPDFVRYSEAHQVPTSAFYLECDPHWSSLGNAVAAEAVERGLRLDPTTDR